MQPERRSVRHAIVRNIGGMRRAGICLGFCLADASGVAEPRMAAEYVARDLALRAHRDGHSPGPPEHERVTGSPRNATGSGVPSSRGGFVSGSEKDPSFNARPAASDAPDPTVCTRVRPDADVGLRGGAFRCRGTGSRAGVVRAFASDRSLIEPAEIAEMVVVWRPARPGLCRSRRSSAEWWVECGTERRVRREVLCRCVI